MYGDHFYKELGVVMLFVVGLSTDVEISEKIQNESAVYHDIIQQSFIDSYRNLTWKLGVVMLFVVGLSTDVEISEKIQNESAVYHDIIQQSFIDSYRNLTWKALSWLSFVNDSCPHIEYVLKIDDDVIFDLFGVVDYLKNHSANANVSDDKRYIMCGVYSEWDKFPHRDNRSKWYVTKEEYAQDVYSPYCRGWQYMMPRSTAINILDAAIGEKFYWIDDYFITGHLGRKINVTFDNIRQSHGSKKELVERKAVFWLASQNRLAEGKQIWDRIRTNYETQKNLNSNENQIQQMS
ncbi:Beta-1,3-galactosyltransferase 1 [Toxocara canis]|uniref:Hexosyltransferase n=1 Tax=Toxocara canis TaxID=6265 RepID=A0A0B2USC5_TOXCA|nr:Beta-1,3-galactosyltransferase 1 [Toxocara canis]